MNVDSSHYKSLDFSDSIWTCKQYNHKISRECFKLHCNCCKKEDRSILVNGFEGFEGFEVTNKIILRAL